MIPASWKAVTSAVPLLCLVGCARADFVVDARGLSPVYEGLALESALVLSGEIEATVSLDVASDATRTLPEALVLREVYGVVAWLDVDADGRCNPRHDLVWGFVAGTDSARQPLVWQVEDDALLDASACGWFAEPMDTAVPVDGPEDTDVGDDTDAEDTDVGDTELPADTDSDD